MFNIFIKNIENRFTFNYFYVIIKNMNKAVLLIIFNREEKAKEVLDAIRKVKPNRLYIAADGPRKNIKEDYEKCKKTREIINYIDWDCQINTLFRDTNLGCEYSVSSAVSWMFEKEEDGIILEDDCVPNEDFFYFCETLLDLYKDNVRIMHIGNNHICENNPKYSYYFSSMASSWGWATWKRAWKYFDLDLIRYSYEDLSNSIENIFRDENMKRFWKERAFYHKKFPRNSAWDTAWIICTMVNNGLCIYPNTNLVRNIGFDETATHTKSDSRFSNLSTSHIGDIIHNKDIKLNMDMDEKILIEFYGINYTDVKALYDEIDRLNFIFDKIINKIVWYIPIRRLRDNVRKYLKDKIKNIKDDRYPIKM